MHLTLVLLVGMTHDLHLQVEPAHLRLAHALPPPPTHITLTISQKKGGRHAALPLPLPTFFPLSPDLSPLSPPTQS